jgi:filamentous hemagglutinin family protein
MKRKKSNRKIIRIALKLVLICGASKSFANPSGLTVSVGSATAQQSGSQLNVTVSPLAVLNWSSFNIGAGETTSFLQPSSSSIVFNIIGGANPSQIYGNLNANGTVILANANGFYFGPNSMVKVGGSFIATTAPLTPDFGTGSAWQFTGMPPLASIVNYGQIQVGQGRSLFLIAEDIQNYGALSAPAGNVTLAAGQSVLVSDSPDGRGLSAQVQLPQGSVDNFGNIMADAGAIALQAKVVNEDGVIQADSVKNQNGVIELAASDQLNLGPNSQISADGDDSPGGSSGGSITLQSENDFSDSTGSRISATGGSQSGNGGSVDVSAPNILSLYSTIDAGAQDGGDGGTFILDPANIVLVSSGSTTYPSGGVSASGSGTLMVNVDSAFLNITAASILLQADGNVTLSTPWNLSATTGKTTGQLTLEAGGNITLGSASPNTSDNITDGNNWSVTLEAGYSPSSQSVISGSSSGSILLDNSSSVQTAQGSVNLAAGNSITIGNGKITTTGGSVNLSGDEGIQINSGVVSTTGSGNISAASTSGNISLTQNGTITATGGSISLYANESILVGSGSVFTTGGGSIFADAVSGDINAGTFNGGTKIGSPTSDYVFNNSGSVPNAVLGGMSTANGGNVTLIAGDDIISSATPPNTATWPGASGTYGAGNVTLIAGNQIIGNYNLADGIGTILAGAQVSSTQAGFLQNQVADPTDFNTTLGTLEAEIMAGTGGIGDIGVQNGSVTPVTLSLIQGSWNAWAGDNIDINEVNNPNGAFNSRQNYNYTYTANSAVNFWAGNAINLLGENLTRVTGITMPPIYAPILTLNAGIGGITVDNSIILFPSSDGELQITTRDGGNLSGVVASGSTTLSGITMSDSNPQSGWATFAQGHADQSLYLEDPNSTPVTLDISGSIEDFALTVPTVADINVVGNTYNFGFIGQNLFSGQTTYINVGHTAKANMEAAGVLDPATDGGLTVGGNITYHGDVTSEVLSSALTTSEFAEVISAEPSLAGLLSYDPTTTTISFIGVMLPATKNSLLESGNSILTGAAATAWQTSIQNLYTDSQNASLGATELALAGPGNFDITANSIDLGVSGGISILAPDTALEAISAYGANLTVTTAGDLQMTTSSIANESYLGAIILDVGGTLDVGGELTPFGDQSSPKGIFTTSGGDIFVTASSDVNVEGSRIAAYDGGNVTIESLNGNVDAGVGGSGNVTLSALELDPLTQQLVAVPATMPGSGILATTVNGSDALLGNIFVETPNGSFSASDAGVIQLSFDGTDASKATTYLLAGYELRDSKGQESLTAGDISGTDTLHDDPSGSTYAATLLNGAGDPIGQLVDISPNENINASGSGVIAQNILAKATGEVSGLFIGFNTVNLDANLISHVVVVGPTVGLTTPNETGPIQIISENPEAINGQLVIPTAPETQAPATQVTPQAATATTAASQSSDSDDDDKKKKGKQIALAQKVSRVTVTLPPKFNPPNPNGNGSTNTPTTTLHETYNSKTQTSITSS